MKVNPLSCILLFRKPQIGVIISKSPRAEGFGGMLSSFYSSCSLITACFAISFIDISPLDLCLQYSH